MTQLKCENPVIIQNPYLKQLVSKYQHVWMKDHWLNLKPLDHLRDSDVEVSCHDPRGNLTTRKESVTEFTGKISRNRFVWADWNTKYAALFWKTRTGVTLETIDDYYIVTPDGEMIPVYMAVPCNKCVLCRERKAKHWQTRCLAETAMSDYPPLFITLTYDNDHLPENGVTKTDVQKFLKRLRIKIERHLKKTCKLRYVLVAEYGKNTHRAHYHMLLWNMPFVSDVGVNSWYALKTFIEEAWSNGWIGLDRCVDASGKYCMKYIRKECVVPKDHNDVFMLSSRRGGIGRAYADSLTEFARQNPALPSIQIYNKFDGSTTNCAIPDYFKRIWFPALSMIVKQEIRDEVANFMELARMSAYCLTKVPDEWRLGSLLDMENYVYEKYPFTTENFDDAVPEKLHRTDIDAVIRDFERWNVLPWLSQDFYKSEWYIVHEEKLKASYAKLQSYHVDKVRIQQLLDLHALHTDLMLQLALSCDPVNIADEVARVKRENVRLERAVNPDGQ